MDRHGSNCNFLPNCVACEVIEALLAREQAHRQNEHELGSKLRKEVEEFRRVQKQKLELETLLSQASSKHRDYEAQLSLARDDQQVLLYELLLERDKLTESERRCSGLFAVNMGLLNMLLDNAGTSQQELLRDALGKALLEREQQRRHIIDLELKISQLESRTGGSAASQCTTIDTSPDLDASIINAKEEDGDQAIYPHLAV